MTEEEKKAIERLKERVNDNEDYKTVQVWLTDDVVAVNTLLNLITKLQKENEKKDKTIKIRLDYEEAYAKLRKQYEELMSTNIIKNEEIKQKDKQIDLMAEYIDEIDVSEVICGEKIICDENCKDCIKQYFETKAKKGE